MYSIPHGGGKSKTVRRREGDGHALRTDHQSAS
jgi:hypothetical protein